MQDLNLRLCSALACKVILFLVQQMGAWLTTSESVLLSLVADSRLPQFKMIQELIRDKSKEAGLGDNNTVQEQVKSSL